MTTEVACLSRVLRQAYGIDVIGITERKSVVGITGEDNRRWVWKWANNWDTEDRLRTMAHITDKLNGLGVQFAGPVAAADGNYLTACDCQGRGYLQPWFIGRHANLGSYRERRWVTAAVATLHQQSRMISPAVLGRMPVSPLSQRIERKRAALVHIWPLAVRHLPELLKMEAQVWETSHLCATAVQRWRPTTPPCFCHRDLAAHNLLVLTGALETEVPVAFVDFDMSGFDSPPLDLLQICNHGLYFAEADERYFSDILEVYQEHAPLSAADRELLWLLFHFPDLLIRSLVEWVRAKCPEKGRWKVLLSMQKEHRRWDILGRPGGQSLPG